MFTIEECKEMIALYIEAEKAVLTGKRYRIGTRELERVDLDEIVENRVKWGNRLRALQNGGKTRIIRRIVPTDM